MKNLLFLNLLFFLFQIATVSAQDNTTTPPKTKDWKFKYQFDSRRTFVARKSVSIFGIRAGLHYKEKYGTGIGYYTSRSWGLFANPISKDFIDTRSTPVQTLPAEVGFDYASVFGEYIFLEKNRWQLTANTQFGVGKVNIKLFDGDSTREFKENKSLMEHSVKAKFKTTRWLDLYGGVGYRYLLNGEQQIKDAFNAPIYIVSFGIYFSEIFKSKRKNKKNK